MKIPPHFPDTRLGLHVIGVATSTSMLLLGFLMFAFRGYCEPILRLTLVFFSKHGRRYDPEDYYLFATLPFVLALVFLIMHVFQLATKARTDGKIDRAIQARWKQTARGAPLEPD
jgi:hypothetical protein